jgi:hypothetical protein
MPRDCATDAGLICLLIHGSRKKKLRVSLVCKKLQQELTAENGGESGEK